MRSAWSPRCAPLLLRAAALGETHVQSERLTADLAGQTPEKDEYSRTRQQMHAHIDVCMGGRVAEELIFGEQQVIDPASDPANLLHSTR